MTHEDRQKRPQTINDLGMQTPRPHQAEAIGACVAGLKRKGSRGQCIMACGTGKTLVGYQVAQGLKAKRVLVLVPSLLLVNQMIREYRAFGAKRILSVCSEDTDSSDDVIRVSVKDLEIDNTTNATEAKEFLEGDGDRIVVSTYQSLRALSEVFGELAFDLAVFDEAHKTAGARSKMFGHGLSDDHVKCARRLFLTATPRHAELKDDGEEAPVYAMNDPKVYGPVLYSLPLRAAIEAGIIDDYRIIVALVDGDVGELGDQAVRVAIDQAMKAYGIRKVFTFHSRVAEAEGFILGATDTLKSARLYHVNGGQSSAERGLKLEGFAAAEAAIMTNAQCLTEGVDLPAADMVAFLSRKKSHIGIVQAVGRVLRKHHSKAKGGFVFIPVFVRPGQDEEAAIFESDWRGVYEVLQAMREQDEPLAAALSKCARGERELPEKLEIMNARKREVELDGDSVGLSEAMRKAIRVKAMRAFIADPEGRKQELLRMAKSGLPRPMVVSNDRKQAALGDALNRYTSHHRSYDETFEREIRAAAPQWFRWHRGEKARHYKAQLLEMATSGSGKPKESSLNQQERLLRVGLDNYTRKKSSQYDARFDHELRAAAPQWFDCIGYSKKTSDQNKEKLLRLAGSGESRPPRRSNDHHMSKLAGALGKYTRKTSCIYDERFNREIRRLAPHWFCPTINKKKKELLKMAQLGMRRPSQTAASDDNRRLGSALGTYTRTTSPCYDPDFDREIRRLAPHWFTKKGSEQP